MHSKLIDIIMKIDDLFFGARRQLKDAQSKLHQLLEILQDAPGDVDASEVADLIKAVAKAITEMDAMANNWQQEAHDKSVGESIDFSIKDFVDERLFFEKPRSLEEIKKETVFEFERLLGSLGDEQ
jgi:hypothetical protein